MLLAAGMAACTPEEQKTPVVEDTAHTIVITADNAGDVRTTLGSDLKYAEWNTSGEYIMIYESVGTSTTAVRSDEAVVVDGKASFTASLNKTTTTTEFRYDALYPAESVVGRDQYTGNVLVNVAEVQLPTATSYDDAADIMVALPQVCNSQPDELAMRFKRVVALAEMTFSGLPADEAISSVTFCCPGNVLTGNLYVSFDEGSAVSNTEAYDAVTANYATPVNATTPIYFAVMPFALSEGDSFIVTVTTTADTYERTVVIPAGRKLEFIAGDLAKFSVDMSESFEESPEAQLAGYWHIAEYRGNTSHDFDIYLSANGNGILELYQKLSSYSWSHYTSAISFAGNTLSGTYSDGVAWSASYYVMFNDDNSRMTWTDTLDSSDISVYERIEALPEGLGTVSLSGRSMVIGEPRFL